jgi:hypothetical protein
MKQKRYGTLGGLTVPVMVYAAFADVIKSTGSEEKALDILNDNLHYRGGPASATRDYICEVVEDETKIARQSKDTGEKDDKGQPIMEITESEGKYIARVCATKNWLDDKGSPRLPTTLQSKIDAWASSAYSNFDKDDKIVGSPVPLAVDAAAPERKPKAPPKLSEEDKALALEFVTGKKSLVKFHDAASKYGIVVPVKKDLDPDQAKAVDQIGWLVKAYFKAKRDEAQAAAKAAF